MARPRALPIGQTVRLVVFGLTISSSWGNGHATLWRGLVRALARLGVRVEFFERDVAWYARHRDLWRMDEAEIVLYASWEEVRERAERSVREADVAMVTSYCVDALPAIALVLASRARRVFYDLDTPVTLDALAQGKPVPYLPPEGLGGFDLVLSYTGGRALDELRTRLGARRTAPLYGSVDPAVHRPVTASAEYLADLSYLGTYAADRQGALEALFLEPARRLPEKRFVLAGAQYPPEVEWPGNVRVFEHLAPPEHAAFFASSPLTLSVTRGAMSRMGWCPSGRLFEAAASGVPCLSDVWDGLDDFFEPGREILVARDTEEALEALRLDHVALREIARAARARALAEHTADHRARELVRLLDLTTGGDHVGDHPRGGTW